MNEIWKKILSVVVGIISTFFNLYGAIFGLVAIIVILDTVTGIIASKIKGIEITSKKANQGFWKKMALFFALFFGVFLDVFIPIALSFISVTLPFKMPFGLIFGCYIIFNESISICENLININPRMIPKWIAKLLKNGVKNIDSAIDFEDEKEKEE